MASEKEIRAAQRLARTIASDILLYNRDKVEKGIQNDTLFELLKAEIKEGKELYSERVTPDLIETYQFLDRALVDILIASQAEVACSLW